MRISVFEVEPWEKEYFRKLVPEHDVRFSPDGLTRDNAGSFAGTEVLSTFIYSQMGRAVLEQLPDLKLIATRSTGYDHIDLDYCREKGVKVCNVPSYGENTVAEHVFGLILTISHNLNEAINRTRRGDFSLQGLRGFDLQGKTLGVVGTGHIGAFVIRMARGFDMRVAAYDVKPDKKLAEQLGFRYVAFDELLGSADVISLHVPANKHTVNLISDKEFDKMKKGAVLINTARGPIIDINALIRALAEGKVAAVGLDVLPEEPTIREEAELLRSVYRKSHNMETLLADHVLLRLRNVFITPHSAFNTREAVGRILETTLDNIQSFIQDSPRNIVVDEKNT